MTSFIRDTIRFLLLENRKYLEMNDGDKGAHGTQQGVPDCHDTELTDSADHAGF